MKSKPLSQILRATREAAGISQVDAARLAGFTSQGSLWRIEHGTMRPSLDTLIKLARVYGVELKFGDERI